MVSRRRFAVSVSTLLAVALIVLSYTVYRVRRDAYLAPAWQTYESDSGDYRILAETFWGVPFDARTYIWYFNGDWGDYIRRVPFREIGVGSVYLASRTVATFFQPTSATIDEAAKALDVMAVKLVLAGAIFFFFHRARRRFGAGVAFFALFCALAPSQWTMTDDFMTEPFLRILYFFMAGFACDFDPKHPERSIVPMLCLLLVTVFFRAQWQTGVMLFLPVIALQYWKARASMQTIALTTLLVVLIPFSVAAVHFVGWGTMQLTPGIGLHVNVKNKGETLRNYCEQVQTPTPLCNSALPKVIWWNIYVGPLLTMEQLADFDRFAKKEAMAPGNLLFAAREGFAHGTNFPRFVANRADFLAMLARTIDALCWIAFVIGLSRPKLRMASMLGLALWLVPMAGYVFAFHDTRHQRPTAGVVLVLAIVIMSALIKECFPHLSRIRFSRSKGK